jgi:cytochrome c1
MPKSILQIAVLPALLLVLLLVPAGCGSRDLSDEQQAGLAAIEAAGCAGCHTIGGVDGADADFGPNLKHIDGKSSIAGSLPNNHQALAHWIESPDKVNPNTLMPDLDVTRKSAEAIATYLETAQ